MDLKSTRALDRLNRVQRFLDDNRLTFPMTESGARRSLDDAIDALLNAALRQALARERSRAASRAIAIYRVALIRDYMRPLVLAARFSNCAPALAESTFLCSGRQSTMDLCADATAMAALAEPHATALIEAGLPADFLQALRDAVKRLDNAVLARGTSISNQVGATHELRAVASRAEVAVQFLDTLLKSRLDGHPALAAQWRACKRVSPPRSARQPGSAGQQRSA